MGLKRGWSPWVIGCIATAVSGLLLAVTLGLGGATGGVLSWSSSLSGESLLGSLPIAMADELQDDQSTGEGESVYCGNIEGDTEDDAASVQPGDVADAFSASATSSEVSPSTILSWENHTYSVYMTKTSWAEADAYCKTQGGHLVTITSQAEQDFVQGNLLASLSSQYWIGLSYATGAWQWVTGEAYGAYTNHATAQTSSTATNDRGVLYARDGYVATYNQAGEIIAQYPVSAGQWAWWTDLARTNFIAGFICEWDNASAVPQPDRVSTPTKLESLWADPVDLSTGAQVIELSYLDQSASIPFSFNLNYDGSRLTQGEVGRGWYCNFEKKLYEYAGKLRYYPTPSSYVEFEQRGTEDVYHTAMPGKGDWTVVVRSDGGYDLNCGYSEKCRFQADGRLFRIENRTGDALIISYDGPITTVIDQQTSKEFVITHDDRGLVTKVESRNMDGVTASITLSYDGNWNLASVTDPRGSTATYAYDGDGRLQSGVDGAGTVYFRNTYDTLGRIIEQDDALDDGRVTRFSYADDVPADGQTTATVTDREAGVAACVFDGQGRLLSRTDQEGHSTSYVYDDDGNVLSETDGNGNTTFKTYDASGSMLTETDPTGAVTCYSYDERGNMLSVMYPDGSTLTNTFDQHNRLVITVDAVGTRTEYFYGGYGGSSPLNRYVGPSNNPKVYSYEYVSGLRTKETDPLGNATTYTYDSLGRTASVTGPLGDSTSYAYDANGNLLSDIDAAGNTTTYTYDCRGNMLTRTDPNGNTTTYSYNGNGKMASAIDAKGATTLYAYDAEDRLGSVEDPKGDLITYAYDAAGNMTEETDATGNTTSYSYDGAGNVLEKTASGGGSTTYSYDACDRPVRKTDPVGIVSEYSYDAVGRLASSVVAGCTTTYSYDLRGCLLSADDPLGNATSYTYDDFGNRLTETDPNGNTTSFVYDVTGNLTSATDPLGGVTSYTYDAGGRLSSTTDANGNTISYAYDAVGRLASTTDALGATKSVTYDGVGNLTSTTDALRYTLSREYDATNRQTSASNARGYKNKYVYDGAGRLVSTMDAYANTTSYTYDAAGRLIEIDGTLEGSQAYDADGNVVSLVNQLGGCTVYSYDVAGRLSSEQTTSGGTVSYEYDTQGLVSKVVNARGQVFKCGYDKAGRLRVVMHDTGNMFYDYDANGNVVEMWGSGGLLTRTYDALNRVVSATDKLGNTTGYDYDAVGNLIGLTYPDGKVVTYTYDAANRMTSVVDWAGRTTSYTYDAVGNLVSTTRPDGSVLTQIYYSGSLLAESKDVSASGETIVHDLYEYNNSARLLAEARSNYGEIAVYNYNYAGYLDGIRWDGFPFDLYAASVEEFNVDEGATLSASTDRITLDNAGNVTATAGIQASYDSQNRLVSFNGQDVSYDADGNMTSGVLEGEQATLSYDQFNRLVQVGGTSFVYDAADNRVSKTDEDETTVYAYDAVGGSNALLSSTDADGETTDYVWGLGLVGHEDASGAYCIYHFDYRGSTVALTDLSGSCRDYFFYGCYGELEEGNAKATPFLYNGRDGVMTDGDGLYYMRARYYAPELMRFISADAVAPSILDPTSLNRYQYANGNPAAFVDPFGRSAVLVAGGLTPHLTPPVSYLVSVWPSTLLMACGTLLKEIGARQVFHL